MAKEVRLNLFLTEAMRDSLSALADKLTTDTGIKHNAADAARWAIAKAIKEDAEKASR